MGSIINPRNPRRACAASFLCVSVCLSVDAYSGTTGYEAAYKQQSVFLVHLMHLKLSMSKVKRCNSGQRVFRSLCLMLEGTEAYQSRYSVVVGVYLV